MTSSISSRQVEFHTLCDGASYIKTSLIAIFIENTPVIAFSDFTKERRITPLTETAVSGEHTQFYNRLSTTGQADFRRLGEENRRVAVIDTAADPNRVVRAQVKSVIREVRVKSFAIGKNDNSKEMSPIKLIMQYSSTTQFVLDRVYHSGRMLCRSMIAHDSHLSKRELPKMYEQLKRADTAFARLYRMGEDVFPFWEANLSSMICAEPDLGTHALKVDVRHDFLDCIRLRVGCFGTKKMQNGWEAVDYGAPLRTYLGERSTLVLEYLGPHMPLMRLLRTIEESYEVDLLKVFNSVLNDVSDLLPFLNQPERAIDALIQFTVRILFAVSSGKRCDLQSPEIQIFQALFRAECKLVKQRETHNKKMGQRQILHHPSLFLLPNSKVEKLEISLDQYRALLRENPIAHTQFEAAKKENLDLFLEEFCKRIYPIKDRYAIAIPTVMGMTTGIPLIDRFLGGKSKTSDPLVKAALMVVEGVIQKSVGSTISDLEGILDKFYMTWACGAFFSSKEVRAAYINVGQDAWVLEFARNHNRLPTYRELIHQFILGGFIETYKAENGGKEPSVAEKIEALKLVWIDAIKWVYAKTPEIGEREIHEQVKRFSNALETLRDFQAALLGTVVAGVKEEDGLFSKSPFHKTFVTHFLGELVRSLGQVVETLFQPLKDERAAKRPMDIVSSATDKFVHTLDTMRTAFSPLSDWWKENCIYESSNKRWIVKGGPRLFENREEWKMRLERELPFDVNYTLTFTKDGENLVATLNKK